MNLSYAQLDLIELWFEARAAGIPAGSSCRTMVELRARLIKAGLWWAIYPRTYALRKQAVTTR